MYIDLEDYMGAFVFQALNKHLQKLQTILLSGGWKIHSIFTTDY